MSNPKKFVLSPLVSALLLWAAASWGGPVPSNRNDFYLPGSQPGEAGPFQTPRMCDNCHGGSGPAPQASFAWQGSMMAQAARDPLFHASMAIAGQDAPQSGELCRRCHSPASWLRRRGEGYARPAVDQDKREGAGGQNTLEGVQCDLCHKLIKPSPLGVSPYPHDPAYTQGTYPEDQFELARLGMIPEHSANGTYIVDVHDGKRGPQVGADAVHQTYYSPFHREAGLCGTCHDVSNPLFSKVMRPLARMDVDGIDVNNSGPAGAVYVANGFGQAAPNFDPYSMFPIERTYSEWKMSAYNSPMGVYAPQFGGSKAYVSDCQDCHMREITVRPPVEEGAPATDGDGLVPVLARQQYPDEIENRGVPPVRGFPLHDLTGGNSFVPLLIGDLYPEEVDKAALAAGMERSAGMLAKAATLELTATEEKQAFRARVRVTNETGHKLPSGNAVGRRMWLNVRAYDSTGALLYESGVYNTATAELLPDGALKVYEIKPGISADWAPFVGLPAGPSFHLALNNYVAKDNRIPPRGFNNVNFGAIQSPAVGCRYADGQYWDETDYTLPAATARVAATLYYQTLSREYAEFLRDENRTNSTGKVLYDGWAAAGKSTPVVMASATALVTPLDTQAPSAPGALLAQSRPGPQVKLAWGAAADNVGVVRYEIFRDDEFLASTPALVYVDRHLEVDKTYAYYVKAYDGAGNVSAASNKASAVTYGKKGPVVVTLDAAGPNPFNAATQFIFALPEAGAVDLSVYNLLGQKVATLVDGMQEAGEHRVTWSAGNMPSGMYWALLRTPTARIAQKVLLLK